MNRVFQLHLAILAGTITAAFAGPPAASLPEEQTGSETGLERGRMQLHEAVAVNYWLVENFLSGQLDEGVAKVVEQSDSVKKFTRRWDPLVAYPETSGLLADWRQIASSGDVDFHLAAGNAFGGTVELSRQLDLMSGFLRMTNVPKAACEALLAERLFADVKSIEVTHSQRQGSAVDGERVNLDAAKTSTCGDGENTVVWKI